MRVVGLIVEYNPLHNGHKHHINEARRITNADVLVVVMSSSFVQRGEPAIFDKWTRTYMALENGVDLVVELPFVYAVQSADIFANRAVEMLNALSVDTIVFGSESGSIEDFEKWYESSKSTEYDEIVKEELKKGFSFPKATAFALSKISGSSEENLSLPNNILGRFYYQAIKDAKYKIDLMTIPRLASDYHDEFLTENVYNIASATSIRKAIFENIDFKSYVPWKVVDATDYLGLSNFFTDIKSILLSMDSEMIKNINLVCEGIENRLHREVVLSDNIIDFISKIVNKRYTRAKVQRILMNVLVGVRKGVSKKISAEKVPYVRILGTNESGRSLLKKLRKENSKTPIIQSIDEIRCDVSSIEERATKIYASKMQFDKGQELIKREYMHPIIWSNSNTKQK